MKIAILSDTHNNWTNFQKALEWIEKEKIQLVLHCGDVTSQEIIDDAKKLFEKAASAEALASQIRFVGGNGDYNLDLPEKMELEIDGKKIAFTHFPKIARELIKSGKFNLVFHGHTHKAWEEKINETRMINPGELAGQFYKPTFATYDTETDKLELKILERL